MTAKIIDLAFRRVCRWHQESMRDPAYRHAQKKWQKECEELEQEVLEAAELGLLGILEEFEEGQEEYMREHVYPPGWE